MLLCGQGKCIRLKISETYKKPLDDNDNILHTKVHQNIAYQILIHGMSLQRF